MKILSTLVATVLMSSISHAAQYTCTVSNGLENDPDAVTISINTAKDENKFVDLADGSSAGCVVFRAKPQLLSCGLYKDENFSNTAVAEIGSSVLSLHIARDGNNTQLTCVKK